MTLAALVFPFALMQAAEPPAPTSPAPPTRFAQCVALIDTSAERAYEEAMAWAADAQELSAYRCAAMAVIALGRVEEGARRLESIAMGSDAGLPAQRAEIFSQAGNAYLLARAPARARSAFTQAATLMASERAALPDILIDRARAYAMEGDWRKAEEDLSRALDLRPNDSLTLRLRATVRYHQRAFELAEADAQAAVAADPASVDARLVLGHAREARRTGQIPEE
jgi:tetratricopeptide (TPR) repeat protein